MFTEISYSRIINWLRIQILVLVCCSISLTCRAANSNDISSVLDRLEHSSSRDPLRALELSDSLLSLDNLTDLQYASVLLYRSQAYTTNSNGIVALELLDECLPIFHKHDESSLILKGLISQAFTNAALDQVTDATNIALEALELAQKESLPKSVAKVYGTLSYIAYVNGNVPESISYLEKTEALQIEISDTLGLSATYNNIAICYKNDGEFVKALEYNKKSLELNKLLNLSNGIAKSYSNIGVVYIQLEQYDIALEYLRSAISINNLHGVSNTVPIRNLALVYTNKGNTDSAGFYYLQASQIDLASKNYRGVKESYSWLLGNALNRKHYEQALYFQQKLDSINTLETENKNAAKLGMLESQQKLYRRNQELDTLKTESKTTRVVLFILAVLLIFVFLFFYQKIRLNAVNNEREKISLEQKVLRSQMNPHFIFNALSAIQNSVLQSKPLESASHLSKFAQLIRQNFDFATKDFISLKDDLSALVNYIETQKIRFPNKFTYFVDVDESIDELATKVPPLLVQPLVENAIEHGFENLKRFGIIRISVTSSKDGIRFSIEDNGHGFKQSNTDTTHALDIIEKRLQILNESKTSSLEVGPNPNGHGTRVTFCLKKNG
jgi:tetratricopeptide (TPR) repeat protein